MPSPPPATIRAITLNCWGLPYITPHLDPRLTAIGQRLATTTPPPDLVCLQECWTQHSYATIARLTAATLPHSKFYHSGVFGAGLALLSRWPIVESSMVPYALNGRPAAFYRGDWFVGKGVACARIEIPAETLGGGDGAVVLEVFNTHLHAPYEPECRDSYLCHRTAQAWQAAALVRGAVERGSLVLAMGDFNMRPGSLAHRVVETHGRVRDVWRVVWPESSLGAAEDEGERERLRLGGRETPGAEVNVRVNGTTCDSVFNTWRWDKAWRKKVERGGEVVIAPDTPDPSAKRLDYIFCGGGEGRTDGWAWSVDGVGVGMMERHETLNCSLSDHFSVEAVLRLGPPSASNTTTTTTTSAPGTLPLSTYDSIASLITAYTAREARQRRLRVSHFFFQVGVSVACLVGVWWAPNYVAFVLMLVSTLGLSVGVVDGLMGFLFVNAEIRALKEFAWEVAAARRRALETELGGDGARHAHGLGKDDGIVGE